MAAPISEQSELLTDANAEQDQMEEPSVPSSEVAIEPDIEQLPEGTLESEPMSGPETKSQESAGPSAFHVVSYPDGHKELTTDILEACDPVAQPESSAHAKNSNEVESSKAEEVDEGQKEPTTVKHFSAKVIQQEDDDEHDNVRKDLSVSATSMTATEDQSLEQTENEAVEMEGVNIEDIDDAVERALLDEVGEDSCGKSAGDNSNELESLQAKSAELNGSSDPGQSDGPGDSQEVSQTHRMEKVYNIDEETRMGLDATPVNDQTLLKESFTYPSLPPKKLFQIDDTKDSEASDTETKMSMTMTDTEDIRLSNTISIDDGTNVSITSDSNTEAPTPTSTRKPFRATREGIGVSQDGLSEGGERVFTAENLFEYQWPLDGGEWHLLQEQVSEYLSVKSFKRKYPDLDRRVCDKEEKDFLRDKGVVTETQSDLGLTALRSEEVYDLMMKDYNDKYQEYITFLQEKQKKVIREKHKEYSEQAKIDKSKMESYSKKAARSAAEFNAHMMREKKDERRAYFDLQTYTVHYPKNMFSSLPPARTKVGPYPVAVLTGQYQDHYMRYRSQQLKYFPVKTVLHDPREPVKYVRPMPESVRLAIIEKQKPQPPPEEKMEVQEVSAVDNSENKENTIVPENTPVSEVEAVAPVMESVEPVTPHVKIEKKTSSKSSSKKRPKIELSPERPKKTFKKARESLLAAEAEVTSEETVAADGAEANKSPDGKNLIPKIHGLEKCRICKQRSTKEERKNEKIVKCAQCGKIGHTNCLDLTEELVAVIKTYPWQCMECKTCVKCLDPFDEDKMMFCDRCDRGYHTFCIGLEALPTGHWECGNCEGLPAVIPKSKSDANADKMEVTTSEQVKSEVETTLPSPAVKTYPPIEPTLEEKKELLEEGEIRVTAPAATASESGQGPSEGSDAAAVLTPGSAGKIERRGRKRKYPIDPNKPKVSHKKQKPAETPKQITGERQSRRLKLKEEEEEEKKKKEEEKMELKKKKMKKKLKKLAAEAAAAAAAANAEAYAASHPEEDCSNLLSQVRSNKTEKLPSSEPQNSEEIKTAGVGGTTDIESSETVPESVDKSAEGTTDKPEGTVTSEKMDTESLKECQEVADSNKSGNGKSSLEESISLAGESKDKEKESDSSTGVSADVSKTEELSKTDEQTTAVPEKEIPDSDKPESSEPLQPPNQSTLKSPDDSAACTTVDEASSGEASAAKEQLQDTIQNEEKKSPVPEVESQQVSMSAGSPNQDISQTNPTMSSPVVPSNAQKEADTAPVTEDLTSALQTSEPSASETPPPNSTKKLSNKDELPISPPLQEETKPEETQRDQEQNKLKLTEDSILTSEEGSETLIQTSNAEHRESDEGISSESQTMQSMPEESASQTQDVPNTSSSSEALLKQEEPSFSSTQPSQDKPEPTTSEPKGPSPPIETSSQVPLSVPSSENQDSQLSSTSVPSSLNDPSSCVSNNSTPSTSTPLSVPATSEAPALPSMSDIPLQSANDDKNQDSKSLEAEASETASEDTKVTKTEDNDKAKSLV